MTPKQRAGKAFEARLRDELLSRLASMGGGVLHFNHWIHFQDANTPPRGSWAQPDLFIVQPKYLWIFESKLTFVESGAEQLCQLYGPLLAHIFPARRQYRVVVCHDLAGPRSGNLPPYLRDLDEIWEAPERDWYLWHWRPKA